jgi:hypothetical protein
MYGGVMNFLIENDLEIDMKKSLEYYRVNSG